jgi:hypothetical protein
MSEFWADPAMPLLVITFVILVLAIALWVYITRPEKPVTPADLDSDTIKVVRIWNPKTEKWVRFDPDKAEGWQKHRVAMRLKAACTHCGRDFSKGTR